MNIKYEGIYADGEDIPLGLGVALSQDADIKNYFENLTDSQKQRIITNTHQVNTVQDMQTYVKNLKQQKEQG